jgi:putative methylase
VRRGDLVRRIQAVPGFSDPRAADEQVVTPAEAAADLLSLADQSDGLAGRSVLDLGTGTGRLAIGAALLGAIPVVGIDRDPSALAIGRRAADAAGVAVEFVESEADAWSRAAEVVVMNPPFGAQRRHADRTFWDRAFALAHRSVYAFALADSRTFIARQAVARHVQIVETRAVPWRLERTFPHHTRDRVSVPVDLWAFAVHREP